MVNWSLWKVNIFNKLKKEKYLKESILKPYLIHVEFEVENILTKIKTDNFLRKYYIEKGFSLDYLIKTTKAFITKLHQLQSIFNPNNF